MNTLQAARDANLQTQILASYFRDPILCARQVFPHWFPEAMPWLHRGMIAIGLKRADFLLNFGEEVWTRGKYRWTKKLLAKLIRCFRYPLDPGNPRGPTAPIFRVRYAADRRTPVAIDMVLTDHVLIIVPRGFSKTTVINFITTYKILFKLTKFTVYISEAATHAKDQIATIRRELAGNDRILALWGQLKPDRTDDETWGADSFETVTGVKIAAKGRGAQIRGLNKFGDRPDTIVLDDVEDKESVATEVQREKTLSWHKSDVEQALQRAEGSSIFVSGTILHPKALLPTLAKTKAYTSIRFGAIDPEGEPLWSWGHGMTLEQIERKKQDMASVGKLYEFYLEIMSEVRDDARLKFRPEYIRYQTLKPADFIARSIHIDPAISNKPGADYCCIAVVGIQENGHKHVCDFHAQRGMPFSEQAHKYFEMKMNWDCTHHSSESTAYQAALAQVIRELMFIKAKTFGTKAYFEIKDTWPGGRKIERVEGILQPIMAAGYLTFQRIWPELELMFLEWPDDYLDGPDAIAGAIANLEPYAPLSIEDPSILDRHHGEPIDFVAPCGGANQGAVP